MPYALFSPEYEWELNGEVNNVVFPTGTALFGDTLFIYYGAADTHIACASVNLPDCGRIVNLYAKMKNKIVPCNLMINLYQKVVDMKIHYSRIT